MRLVDHPVVLVCIEMVLKAPREEREKTIKECLAMLDRNRHPKEAQAEVEREMRRQLAKLDRSAN